MSMGVLVSVVRFTGKVQESSDSSAKGGSRVSVKSSHDPLVGSRTHRYELRLGLSSTASGGSRVVDGLNISAVS